jgi:hypothetical protein
VLKTAPLDSIADFHRALAIARLPLQLRLLLVWLSLNIGRQVPNSMGSFAISALGSHGAAIVGAIPVWSSFLNYGPIAPDGGVDIYLSVDHRVIDGGARSPRHRGAGGHAEWPSVGRIASTGRHELRCGRGWWTTERPHMTRRKHQIKETNFPKMKATAPRQLASLPIGIGRSKAQVDARARCRPMVRLIVVWTRLAPRRQPAASPPRRFD